MKTLNRFRGWTWIACIALAGGARAQCAHWTSGFGVAGTDDSVLALATYDDGSGLQLYAGGGFTVAGDASARNIARWNGSVWSGVGVVPGGPPSGAVFDAQVFDDGTGPALYVACTSPEQIKKWNGTAWSTLPSVPVGSIRSLEVFDDGTGPALYVGGNFTTIGGLTVNHIARWNGVLWSALASGVSAAVSPIVYEMTTFDDGSGPALYVGGHFTSASGVTVNNVARWNGTSWSALGSGMQGGVTDTTVFALQAFASGGGPARLYAAGEFTSAGGAGANRIACWDGASWASLGTGLNGYAQALAAHDDGSGPALYVGGGFNTAGGTNVTGVARWNGTAWSALAPPSPPFTNTVVTSLHVFDPGSGPRLYAGGDFRELGGVAAKFVAAWNGATWSPLGTDGGANASVYALRAHDDGGGTRLFAGGNFSAIGGVAVNGIASWDGTSWIPTGAASGFNTTVTVLVPHDDGTGNALYAAGLFTSIGGVNASNIARWDGATWSPLGSGTGSGVRAVASLDDGTGPALYVAGSIGIAGGMLVNNVVRWRNGAWSSVGAGTNGPVDALVVFDDGGGPALIAAGSFTSAGGAPASRIARWDGASWSPLGSGLDGTGRALAVHDDGSGPGLIAGGEFDHAGGVIAHHVARWRNGVWSALGNGVSGFGTVRVVGFAKHDDGTGGGVELYAVGNFDLNVGANVARWDGYRWTSLGSGVSGSPSAGTPGAFCVAEYDVGNGTDLYVGGSITTSAPYAALGLARWSRCHDQLFSFCAGDFNGGLGYCPCANFGNTGHGCANSFFADGALLSISGTPSLANDTLQLAAGGMPNSIALFLQGTARVNGGVGEPLFDGLWCVGGTLTRLRAASVVANTARFPIAGDPSLSVRGGVTAPGTIRHYQVLYRNAAAAFCPPATSNWTNATTAIWAP